MRKMVLLLLVIMTLGTSMVFASGSMSMGGVAGTQVLTDSDGNQRLYSKLSLQPEFTFGKMGIGLDLYVYFDKDGKIRPDDWDSFDEIVKKILYVRYAQKRDPLYFYFGAMPAMTIGHNMIFNRYSNMLFYPDKRIQGMAFDVNTKRGGIETLTSNVARAGAMGARIYYRPLYLSSFSLLQGLAIGASFGTDQDPDETSSVTNNEVSVIGIDAELPLVSRSMFSSLWYADAAQMQLGSLYTSSHTYVKGTSTETSVGSKNNGIGYATGFLGKLFIFDYRAEYKILDNNFLYGYFNTFYEVEKKYKAHEIPSTSEPQKEGPYASLGYTLEQKLKCLVSYEDYNHDPLHEYPWVHAEFSLDKKLFADKAFWKFTYDKKNAHSMQDLTKVNGANTVMKTEWGYCIAASIMVVVVQEQRFDALGKPTSQMYLETRVVF